MRAKAEAAWRAGLVPIVCIGETVAEREAGKTLDVVARQLKGIVPGGRPRQRLVVAYEPVWAIGTGKTADHGRGGRSARAYSQGAGAAWTDDAAAVRLLYGGSVKAGQRRRAAWRRPTSMARWSAAQA